MTTQVEKKYDIGSVEELLAHSLTMETEAADRYREIADSMETHNNPEVAKLFNLLAGYADKHAAEMQELAQGRDLPHIAPWDFVWEDGDSPEAADTFQTHYKMTPYHVLQLALKVEQGAHDFYSKISKDSTNEDVIKMAAEFADEEQEHVELLNEWVGRYPEPDKNWDEDLDPPMMHE
ncbi:ferritin family protein [Terasakiella sp. A23]|uniref:ferritin-like domain-containing protein n=1 Tax=Terasakiella sp. FCG-A23 TaxID=3080561 RepID=UPI002953DCDE|nr:ferritin family protein [Terasakiella sp. A23]MDV7339405.1 ferritin family protein [Terasakiella sp. A23]